MNPPKPIHCLVKLYQDAKAHFCHRPEPHIPMKENWGNGMSKREMILGGLALTAAAGTASILITLPFLFLTGDLSCGSN